MLIISRDVEEIWNGLSFLLLLWPKVHSVFPRAEVYRARINVSKGSECWRNGDRVGEGRLRPQGALIVGGAGRWRANKPKSGDSGGNARNDE